MKKRDWIIILVIVVAILAVMFLGKGLKAPIGGDKLLDGESGVALQTQAPTDVPAPEEEHTSAPESPAPTAEGNVATQQPPKPTLAPAKAYLKVTAGQQVSLPIPLVEEDDYVLTMADGSENTIHVTKNAVWMASANCEDQSCVEQGTVSLDNKDERVLLNMIICLPHGVVLELLTPEEAQAEWEYWYGQQ